METGQPSVTAAGAAKWRAAHLLLDNDPKIFQDHLALGLSGVDSEATLLANIDALITKAATRLGSELAQRVFRYSRAMMTMRSRYTEEALDRAIECGVTQYVILGAGLDSFAYRQQELADRLQIFEIDHPATQQWKQKRLRELSVELPPNLTFIPIDFEKQTLTEGLCAGGYCLEKPAFFSWLGGTQYLTEEAVFSTLKQVAALVPGTELTFTYVISEAQLDGENQRLLAMHKAGAAARGEPWLSLFESAHLATRLRELGFTQIANFSPEQANARYFVGRTDGLCVPSLEHIMRAHRLGACVSLSCRFFTAHSGAKAEGG